MEKIKEIEAALNAGGEDKVKVLKPIIEQGVKLGLMPKVVDTDNYMKNWDCAEKMVRAMLDSLTVDEN